MTTFLSTYATLTNTTNWQALAGAIDSHLTTFGLVLTSDTGQTDPGAAAIPANNTSAGYRVYRTNDGLTNIYIRIDYFRGSGNQIRLKIQAGWGTDGAGTLTGNTCTQLDLVIADPGATAQLAMAGSSSWFTITWAVDRNDAGVCMCVAFERDCDTTGADVATGFNILSGRNQTWTQQFVPSSGTVGTQQTQIICCHPSTTSTAVIGANTLVSPSIPIKETGGGNPSRYWMGYTNPDFTNNTTATVTLYGVSHTYLAGTSSSFNGLSSNFRGLWRYE